MVLKTMANDEITDGEWGVVCLQFLHAAKFPGATLIQ